MRYIFLLLFIQVYSCSAQKNDCNKFRTGTFEYLDNNNIKQTVIRNDSTQIEFNDKDNIKIITTVKWISDCKYILTYKDIQNYQKKDEVIGKSITVEILKTKENTYTARAVSDAIDDKIIFTKIK